MMNIKQLPWATQETPSGKAKIVDALGFSVANTTSGPYDDQRATAAFIVRACNLHEQLVAAMRDLDACYCEVGSPMTSDDRLRHRKALIAARAALAAAEAA
jgi:hypothetical protein